MIRGHPHILILTVACLPDPAIATDDTDRLCDPVTNVCYCTGGWDGTDCAAMKPLCEPGFWRACSDTGVCSCTRKPWVYDPETGATSPDLDTLRNDPSEPQPQP